ncbi:MAG: tetratricopeptide repeat protein [Cohaesibacteraceae bacterium]|nr:tetratricopeptide repeat protein [Cohaesibacteraceae bacterium]
MRHSAWNLLQVIWFFGTIPGLSSPVVAQVHDNYLQDKSGIEDRVLALSGKALKLMHARRYQQAELLFRKAQILAQENFGDHHSLTAESFNNRAANLLKLNMPAQAQPFAIMALNFYNQQYGGKHPGSIRGYASLAEALGAQRRWNAAELAYRRVQSITISMYGVHHPGLARSATKFAQFLQKRGDHPGAGAMYRTALAIDQREMHSKDPNLLVSKFNLGQLLAVAGREIEAGALLRQVLVSSKQILGDRHPRTRYYKRRIAAVLNKARQAKKSGNMNWAWLPVR